MTKTIITIIILIIAIVMVALFARRATQNTQSVDTVDQATLIPFKLPYSDGTYVSDEKVATKNGLTWTGTKIGGTHTGSVRLKNAAVTLSQGVVTGGTIDIDMDSIDDFDITDIEQNQKLVNHLKSPEFFDVATYPVSTFVISGIYTNPTGELFVRGTMTVHGISKEITMPISISNNVNLTDPVNLNANEPQPLDAFQVTGVLSLNRHDYGIMINPALDKVVDNLFTVNFEITFAK